MVARAASRRDPGPRAQAHAGPGDARDRPSRARRPKEEAALRSEHHAIHRVGWLRAAVLGAHDGIVSTASLVVGVAAAATGTHGVMIAGVAGLAAGARSMAAGEYVSVASQADTERADLAQERAELARDPGSERTELTEIYVARGLDRAVAEQVAAQLEAHDALGAHARDELGLSSVHVARPVQAAFASAATFAVGAALPLVAAWAAPGSQVIARVAGASLVSLAALGAVAARAGGAPMGRAAARVTFWGAVAMAATAGVGLLFGVAA